MMRVRAFPAALALVVALLPGLAGAAARSATFTLIYGNDVRGELAPCG